MRLLIISPWLPHPEIAHAGGQHLYHTIASLTQRGHQVHALCYGRGEPPEAVAALEGRCASLHVVTPAYAPRDKLRSFLRDGWRRPWTLGRRTHLAVRARIRELCFDAGVDVVHLAWTEMGRYLDAVPRCTATLLGTLDVEAEVRPREVAILPRGPRRRRARAAARRLARRERRYVRRADAVVAVSAADAAALGRLRGKDDVTIVPPWLDAKILGRVTPEEVVAGRLTFVGALEREANRAAARWLVDEVWPRVRATHGRATLHLVGGSPPEDLRRRAVGEASLVVTGWVPDLIPVWAATDVAVAPSPVGGGLLLKVAQPMAAGRPVVTTTLGNAGVAAPGGAVAVADEAGAFAAEVVRLLNDGERWRRLAKRGRDHVLTTLNWEDGMERLEAAYAAALARRGRA